MKKRFQISNYTRLLRIGQWYKNLLIFIPLLFAMPGEVHTLPSLIIGFICFCAVSSITYMINDWVDREADRLHPTKKNRPLASGEISGKTAIIIGIILSLIVISGSFYLGSFYAYIVATYFIMTNAYSLGLKNIPVLDLIIIAGNFMLRTLAGMTIFTDTHSLPYFVGIFSVIIIFLTHKRRSDIKLLGGEAAAHKPVLKFYTERNSYLIRLLGYLGIFYAAYILYTDGTSLQKLIPILALVIFISTLLSKKPHLAINPHHIFKKRI
ncbi:MAG: UbiA prenyltransferase family protein [Candidatus Peregrinibacteria bacterium]|nr:UbiA prenyltransferase family protein [Candidatus Peregrinibacteria bacterium]MDZ4244693.1 UbiA prenyltransferase family protein [Candidatus Gracilibacteria bacterium]